MVRKDNIWRSRGSYPSRTGLKGKSKGPLIVIGLTMGLISVIGYFFDKEYSAVSQIDWLVYFSGAVSIICLFFAIFIKEK